MASSNAQLIRYVFIDVVGYSTKHVETQSYIVEKLSSIVKRAVITILKEVKEVIYVPIGDGICIAILGSNIEYDDHVKIALEILRRLESSHNVRADESKQFHIRIGINENVDNIITDINGNRNVAGAGVNEAQRIMSFADASQVMVGRATYEVLRYRQRYANAFKQHIGQTKHNVSLDLYQLVQNNVAALNKGTPSAFMTEEIKLPKLAAYYLAYAAKLEDFIRDRAKDYLSEHHLQMMIWFLAKDALERSEASPTDLHTRSVLPDTGDISIEGVLAWFQKNVDFTVALEVSNALVENAFPEPFRYKYLDISNLIVNLAGKHTLKAQYPDICKELALEDL